ncbi:MAG: dihydroorotate dehydrogenase 2 [Planctomycetia bacterium]|nr:dihydroorotate dehydrogenase 2 [Planctomycetia bacterium]
MYHLAGPLIRCLPPEIAHAAGLQLLKLPVRWAKTIHDPFTWNGLTFRNCVGIAAGFDKNATALNGIERLGVGFVEVGTILVEPWPGNPKPRLERLSQVQGIWNKLGFPSDGVQAVLERLKRFPTAKREGMLVACNIGPHPGHLKQCNSPESYLNVARAELLALVDQLAEHTDFFVINLSSPNTAGLRGLLSDPRLTSELILPVKEKLQTLEQQAGRKLPLLMKLPPDDPDKQAWTDASLRALVEPILSSNACDGWVAVNTSTRATQTLLQRDAGGISGAPLLPMAIQIIEHLRNIVGPEMLIVGCGGITAPEHAERLVSAGAQLVELYSGMIYAGPGLPAACAQHLQENRA